MKYKIVPLEEPDRILLLVQIGTGIWHLYDIYANKKQAMQAANRLAIDLEVPCQPGDLDLSNQQWPLEAVVVD